MRISAYVSVVALAAVVLAASPAHASGSSYVALGDSYSSGMGTRTYLDDGTSCQRSAYAYPSLIASSKGYSLNLRACSGATTADVTNLQLSALSSDTGYVSLTVGGNDAGFAGVLTECAKPAWAGNCNSAIDAARSIITARLPARLTALYASIRKRAPQARVVVAGYPRIFTGADCNALTWFSPTEQTRLNYTADLLNATISTAASAAGFGFSNPTPAFTGHGVCADAAWINGLSNPTSSSYHPNRLGHASGYAPLVGSALTGGTVTMTATTALQAAASAGRLASRQRQYAEQDRTIKPERFLLPDLRSAATRAAAARAGVDLSRRASIDSADKRFSATQAWRAARQP